MEHGALSFTYRNAYREYSQYGMEVSEYGFKSIMRRVTDASLDIYRVASTLRNGPRILRACDTMRRELEAEREQVEA